MHKRVLDFTMGVQLKYWIWGVQTSIVIGLYLCIHMYMIVACAYTHKKCRCKLGGVKKDCLCCQILFPNDFPIVSTKPGVQYVLMVLNIAETNKKMENWS